MAKPPKVKLKVSPLSAAKEVVTVTPYQLANEKAPLFGQSADPHARSLQQGFEHGWNHGTTGDITSFDRSMLGETTGANSAKKGFFFARDPQNPPEHLTKKSTDQKTIEMLRKAGVDVDALNTVSMEGNGAQTASDYSRMGGSREYKEAIKAFNNLLGKDPEHARAPDAMLSVANCQLEMKDVKSARKTFEELLKKYPQTESAAAAKERLSKLK